MGRRIGSVIVWVVATSACRDVEEAPGEPSSTASSAADETSSSTTSDTSTSSSTDGSSSDTTSAPVDMDGATTTSSSSADETTDADDPLPELVCGEGFMLGDASAAPLVEIDDRRVLETLEVTVRAEHPAFASVEIAIVKDDVRRVLLAPGAVDCGGELSVYFSDFGRLHAEDACFTEEPDDRVLPAESLDVLANAPVAGAWTLETTGDPAELGAITAWCLVLRFAD